MLHARRSAAVLVALPVLLVVGLRLRSRHGSLPRRGVGRMAEDLRPACRRAGRDAQRQRTDRGAAVQRPYGRSRRDQDGARRHRRGGEGGAGRRSRLSRTSSADIIRLETKLPRGGGFFTRRRRSSLHGEGAGVGGRREFIDRQRRHRGHRPHGPDQGRNDQRRHRRPRHRRVDRGDDHQRRRRRRPDARRGRRRQARVHQRRHQAAAAGDAQGDHLGERHQWRHRHRRAAARDDGVEPRAGSKRG